jgi:hypothetical protein
MAQMQVPSGLLPIAQPDWSSVLKAAQASRGYCRTIQDIQKQAMQIEQEELEAQKRREEEEESSEESSEAEEEESESESASGSGSDEDEDGSSTKDQQEERTQDTISTDDDCCIYRPDLQPSYGYNILPWTEARYEMAIPPPLPLPPSHRDIDIKSVPPSTSSSTRKKRQQPQKVGLLEAIFAPGPAKKTAAVRPHVSRRHTTPSKERDDSTVSSEHTKVSSKGKSKTSPPEPKRQSSGGLLSSLLGPAPPKKDPRRQ